MQDERDFWIGCLSGLFVATVFSLVSMFLIVSTIKSMKQEMIKLQAVQTEQAKWIEDNKYVMQTYKFFNESWDAILRYENDKREQNRKAN